MKRIALFGGTGQLGQKLMKLLCTNGHSVTSFERKSHASQFGELKAVVDFDSLEVTHFEGDAVVVAIGSTRAKAGSKEAFVAVDFELVYKIAKWAKERGIQEFHVISSIGTKEKAKGLYLQTKWKMEQAVTALGFEKLFIYRPSLYTDIDRKPFRIKEILAIPFLALWASLSKKTLKYRPINTKFIAQQILDSLESESVGRQIYEGDEICASAVISPQQINKRTQEIASLGIESLALYIGVSVLLGRVRVLYLLVVSSFVVLAFLMWVISSFSQQRAAAREKTISQYLKLNFMRLYTWVFLVGLLWELVNGAFYTAIAFVILLWFNVSLFYIRVDVENTSNRE